MKGGKIETLVQDHINEIPDLFSNWIFGLNGDSKGLQLIIIRKFVLDNQLLIKEIQIRMTIFLVDKTG